MSTTTDAGSTPAQDTKNRAADGAAAAQEKLSDAASAAQEKLSGAADQAKDQAAQATDKAKGQLRDQFDQRSGDFAGRAQSTAGDLRSVSEQLREQGKDQPAKLADQIADRIDRGAGYLERSDVDRLLADLEDFGRKRPWAVIAGGMAIGFAASRLLKSTSADRYHSARPSSSAAAPVTPNRMSQPATFGTAGTTGRTPSPLDDLGVDTARVAGQAGYPAGAESTPGAQSTAGAPTSPGSTIGLGSVRSTPGGVDPQTTIHRDRENGLG